jgi:hypothetical protein
LKKQRQQLGTTFNNWLDELYHRQGGPANRAHATREHQKAYEAMKAYEEEYPDFTTQYKDKIAKKNELKNAGVHKYSR